MRDTYGFPGGSDGKASARSAGDPGSIPASGRSLEKEMAPHSSTLAWKIPWTEEPGRLQSTRVAKRRTRLSDFASREAHEEARMYEPRMRVALALGPDPLCASPRTAAARLLRPWDSPGKNTGAGCHALRQGIFLTQGSNLHLLCLLQEKQQSIESVLEKTYKVDFFSYFKCAQNATVK